MKNKNYDLKRYLVEIKVYVSDNKETLLLDTLTVESDSATCVYLPSIKLFKEEAKLNITTSVLEERFYVDSHSNAGMIELIKVNKIK